MTRRQLQEWVARPPSYQAEDARAHVCCVTACDGKGWRWLSCTRMCVVHWCGVCVIVSLRPL